jgi:hypothetical protein
VVTAALTSSAGTDGTVGHLWLTGAVAGLAVSIGLTATTDSGSAGIWAALLAAFLSAPIHFAVDMTALLRVSDYALTSPFDNVAYPHSGFTDTAGYVLGDALGGEIIDMPSRPSACSATDVTYRAPVVLLPMWTWCKVGSYRPMLWSGPARRRAEWSGRTAECRCPVLGSEELSEPISNRSSEPPIRESWPLPRGYWVPATRPRTWRRRCS